MMDLNNYWHMRIMRNIFVDDIQEDMDNFVAAWNKHRVRWINEK